MLVIILQILMNAADLKIDVPTNVWTLQGLSVVNAQKVTTYLKETPTSVWVSLHLLCLLFKLVGLCDMQLGLSDLIKFKLIILRLSFLQPHLPFIVQWPADIQECAYDNGGCSDICWNTKGSYECRCPPNKVLSADNKTCISELYAEDVYGWQAY